MRSEDRASPGEEPGSLGATLCSLPLPTHPVVCPMCLQVKALNRNSWDPSTPGFLTLSTVGIVSYITLRRRSLSCVLRSVYLAASQASTHSILVLIIKNVSRHGQLSPGGQIALN